MVSLHLCCALLFFLVGFLPQSVAPTDFRVAA
jgi:hypothetical protein